MIAATLIDTAASAASLVSEDAIRDVATLAGTVAAAILAFLANRNIQHNTTLTQATKLQTDTIYHQTNSTMTNLRADLSIANHKIAQLLNQAELMAIELKALKQTIVTSPSDTHPPRPQ